MALSRKHLSPYRYDFLPLWGRAGVGACGDGTSAAPTDAPRAPIPAFPQREKEPKTTIPMRTLYSQMGGVGAFSLHHIP
ncbi:MAG: hypothetical protein BGO13_02660 [Burkholderiales bacterium 66-5]|nr:MAG: hypothetical protein BGO13_02660 [Burkholderiales bacterium 66-5]